MNSKGRSTSHLALCLAMTLFICPSLYVLSSGPMVLAVVLECVDDKTFSRIYFPLHYAAQRNSAVHACFYRYQNFWADLLGPRYMRQRAV